jgi:hypothetical protein
MKGRRQIRRGVSVLLALFGLGGVRAGAQNVYLEATAPVADGVHLWYEVKADPEEPNNMILCGTKWDALTNGPYGFVYASFDSGSTWQAVLEDRNSAWVTEHSCAFGPQHRAYFISEASRVFDGEQHHDLGVTRLFVSADAGKHWAETNKTGWADYSSSAVSSANGRLYTFFNDPSTSDPGRNRGYGIGLLVFSPDGTRVQGPFSVPEMRQDGYQGVYPTDATSLKNGGVSALYYAARKTATSMEGELGLIRADVSAEPSLERHVIARGTFDKDCLSFDDNALTYDRERNRLFVVYVEGCTTTRMMLTSSDDEGRTWTKSAMIAERREGTRMMFPSLAVGPGGELDLLWSEWSEATGRWLFGQIRDTKFLGPPIEISHGAQALAVMSDSLWTAIYRPREPLSKGASASSGEIAIDVRGLADVVWRTSGLVATGDKVLAIWPSIGAEGMRLDRGVLRAGSGPDDKHSLALPATAERDVTRRSIITYGGRQSFDRATGTLTVCLAVANRGNESIRLPIRLEVTDVQAPGGPVSLLNATNSLNGPGAIWDISNSVTGDRLRPGAATNPFCLSVHVSGLARNASPLNESILTLKVRVLAFGENAPGRGTEP